MQIGFGYSYEDTVNTNYFGPRRVNDAFGQLLVPEGGRIVNIGSAGGSGFISKLPEGSRLREQLSKPWTIQGGVAELDEIAREIKTDETYRASKALLHAYTVIHGKSQSGVLVNAVSPGWINTKLTAGMGATNPPSKGAVAPCFILMDESIASQPQGRYYGSDGVRSPLDTYRGPGDAPYVSDEDLVDLSAST